MMAHRSYKQVWSWLIMPILLVGCESSSWDWMSKDKQTTRPAEALDDQNSVAAMRRSPTFERIVGSATYVRGGLGLRVRGYGLVVGLAGRGSTYCPSSMQEYLIQEIRKLNSNDIYSESDMTAEQLIESIDTAAVLVEATIPPGCVKGETFDVRVEALDEDTKTLAGGYLIPCNLRIFREVSPARVIEGKIHGKVRGPLFVNPFVHSGDSATVVNAREASIIGGGVNLQDRKLSLVTVVESYSTVRQVMSAINRRFAPETANAVSPTNVELVLPEQYQSRVARFLELVKYLPLSSSSMERERQAKLLVEALASPDAPHQDIALCLEGIGPSMIPMIQRLYTSKRRRINYFAARTGMRLGDDLAVEVIIRHANDRRSPFRFQAIREMGDCAMPRRASTALRALLDGNDSRIRILAYEALRKLERSPIVRCLVGKKAQNYIIEVVQSEGTPLIYARRTRIRRIALIGGDRMVLKPPLLYSEPGKPVMLSARAGEDSITVLKKNPFGKSTAGPLKIPLSVPRLVRFLGDDLETSKDGRLMGLSLDYASVLDVLYRLCEKKVTNADMRWEEPSVEELIGPLTPMGRPESEL